MKTVVASLLLLFVAATARAGGFGGPAPFQNGSPLQSGIDGSYSATLQGDNITGIFGFQISGGIQTSTSGTSSTGVSNSWVAFVGGNVYQGTTQVAISSSSVSGILNSSSTNTEAEAGGTAVSLPIIVDSALVANGNFTGSMDLNSPTGAFHGKGELVASGQSPQTISYTGFFDELIGFTPGMNPTPIIEQVLQTVTTTIPSQTGFGTAKFNFAGTRNSITTTQ